MSRRLRNIERMHPALAASSCPSKASSTFSLNLLQSEPRTSTDSIDIHFEKALEKSPAYKRAGFNRLGVSKSSSTISPGPSFLSGLSLGDVDNVSAVALPISSRELWNHHRYVAGKSGDMKAGTQVLDAWYNPPPTVGSPNLKPYCRESKLSNTHAWVVEKRFHQDGLLQRPIHESIRAT